MPRSFTGLWNHPVFLRLWVGQTVSLFGSQITLIALPLVATMTLQATPTQMAALRAFQYAPAVLVGLLIGAWVDRQRRRPLLIGAHLGSAVVLLLLPLATAFGWLHIVLLYTIAFLLGVLGFLAGTAFAAFLPLAVGRIHLVEANSRLAASDSVARIAGPGLVGALVQLVSAPIAVAVDGVSFLVAALALWRIRIVEPSPAAAARRHLGPEIIAGMRALVSRPILLLPTLSSATLDLFWNALFALYFLYVTRTLGLPAGALGLIFGLGSAGALLASLVARQIADRFGIGVTLIGAQGLLTAGGLLIALSVGLPQAALPLLIVAELVQSGAGTVYGITRASLIQAATPDDLRGRVGASIRFIGLGVTTLGAMLGGVLGEWLGVPATMTVAAVGGLLACPWLLAAPIRRLRELPASPP